MITEAVALLLWDGQHIEDHNLQKLADINTLHLRTLSLDSFNMHDDLYVMTHLLIHISQLKCLFLFVMVK